jgi:hypothetical protein
MKSGRRSRPDPYSQDRLNAGARGTGRSLVKQNQQISVLQIPGTPHLLTNTVTTGVLQYVLKLDPLADIENFGTRFGADYEEVRCLKARVMILTTGLSQGVSAIWIDEKYANTPTSTESMGKNVMFLSNNSSRVQREMFTWIPNDIADMTFVTATSASIGQAAYFKVFTNNAAYNAPVVATSLFLVQVLYTCEFRGVQE